MIITQQQAYDFARRAGFTGQAIDIVVAIAQAESGLDTAAVNLVKGGVADASRDRGIMQINSYWHKEVIDACAFEPLCAFAAAYGISKGGTDFSPWTTYTNGAYRRYLPMQPWYTYPIGVPFGNPNYDTQYGGSHDMTILAPANTSVTALVAGTVSSITAPPWGKQVGIKLDTPVNNIPYMSYLHLSAVNPALSVGQHINVGDSIGWVGGATQASQYAGTSNPTGQNFLNDPSQSSRVQVGIALMRGPEYGVGQGWVVFPPIDTSLDPISLLPNSQPIPTVLQFTAQEVAVWNEVIHGLSTTTGIAQAWASAWRTPPHRVYGPPLTREFSVPVGKNTYPYQVFTNAVAHWDGTQAVFENEGGKVG